VLADRAPVTGVHRLSDRAFADLATGYGDPTVIATLRAAQLSKHLLMIRAVLDRAARLAPEQAARARLAETFAMLAAAHRADPDAVNDLLSRPQVGGWAGHCLRRLVDPNAAADRPMWTDLAYLGRLAEPGAVWRLAAEADGLSMSVELDDVG
jgi:HEXXH motif-containing protein